MASVVRGRFAPTPSGLMHVGNAWTALLSWCAARTAGGSWVMRMEDLDAPRCRPEWIAQCLEDLLWLGLDWDEGPDVGGPYGPYLQQARTHLYVDALTRLEAKGQLYPCFCSRAELSRLASAPHGLSGERVYPGTCRYLSTEEIAQRSARKTPSLRLRMPERSWTFVDGVLGPQQFDPPAGGDFVVRRADGVIAYQLAVVVDDAAMRITQVVRGADLLDSTPRQLALYEALDLTPPQFAHVPLLCGPDGRRLAKRHGDFSLKALRQVGRGPEVLIGWLAWLGGFIDRMEPLTARDLLAGFRLDRVPRECIVIDEGRLAALKAGYGLA